MKTIITFTFLLLSVFCPVKTLQAQTTPNVLWAKQFGGANMDNPKDMVTDKNGNIYIAGEFRNETNFGDITLTAQGMSMGFIAKTDPLGTLLWAKQFGGNGMDVITGITTDNLGNVYSLGTFTNEATFGTSTFDAGSFPDIFVIKQDLSGDVIWATHFVGLQESGFLYPRSIAADDQNNIYTLGTFKGISVSFGNTILTPQGTNDNVFIVKQDSSGNILWAKNFESTGSNTSFSKITADDSGNIYFTGSFSGTLNIGNITLTNSNQNTNFFLGKLDPMGEALWVKSFGGDIPDSSARGNNIVIDTNGNIYITGIFWGTVQIGTTTLFSNGSTQNTFVIKTDNLGELIWVKGIESNNLIVGIGIAVDTSSNVYMTGRFDGPVWFDNILLSTNGLPDTFVLKMNSLGMIEWAGKFDGDGDGIGIRVAVDTTGDILVSGYFSQTRTFGTTTLISVSNSDDIFLIKLSPDGLATEKNEIGSWNVYPNPVNNFITLDFSGNAEKISVEVLNMLGQKIKMFKNISSTETLDLSDLTAGVYLLNINHNETTQTIKIKK